MKVIESWKAFSELVALRLGSKYKEGKRGWDGEYPISSILKELREDLKVVNCNLKSSLLLSSDELKLLCQDIAARAMFVHHHISKKAKERTDDAKARCDERKTSD
jgi:hypothetical protein